jgi:hypothetical protein
VGGAAVTSNVPLVAEVSPEAVAVMVNAEPAWLTAQPLNEATPAETVFARPPVQLSVPVPLSESVTTVVLSLTTVAFAAVCTATTGCAASALPATPAPGWVVNVSFVAPAEIVNTCGVTDTPPPGAGLKTVTFAAPADATLAAGTVAVRLVGDPYVVARLAPFHCTTEPATKFVPVTVIENWADPAPTVLGERTESVGTGLGAALMVKPAELDVPPPGAAVNTVTVAAPGLRMFAAGTDASRTVGLM